MYDCGKNQTEIKGDYFIVLNEINFYVVCVK